MYYTYLKCAESEYIFETYDYGTISWDIAIKSCENCTNFQKLKML
jgi:hypothetical protein